MFFIENQNHNPKGNDYVRSYSPPKFVNGVPVVPPTSAIPLTVALSEAKANAKGAFVIPRLDLSGIHTEQQKKIMRLQHRIDTALIKAHEAKILSSPRTGYAIPKQEAIEDYALKLKVVDNLKDQLTQLTGVARSVAKH